MEPENINKNIWQKIQDKFEFLNPNTEKLKKEVIEYKNIRNFYKTYRGIVSIFFILLSSFFALEIYKELITIDKGTAISLTKIAFILVISLLIAFGRIWAMKILIFCMFIFQIQLSIFLHNTSEKLFIVGLVANIELFLLIMFFTTILFKAMKVESEREEYFKKPELWLKKIEDHKKQIILDRKNKYKDYKMGNWQKIQNKFSFLNPSSKALKKEIIENNKINIFTTRRFNLSFLIIFMAHVSLATNYQELFVNINLIKLLIISYSCFLLIISLFIAFRKIWSMQIFIIVSILFEISLFTIIYFKNPNIIDNPYFIEAMIRPIAFMIAMIWTAFNAIKIEYERIAYYKDPDLWAKEINKKLEKKAEKKKVNTKYFGKKVISKLYDYTLLYFFVDAFILSIEIVFLDEMDVSFLGDKDYAYFLQISALLIFVFSLFFMETIIKNNSNTNLSLKNSESEISSNYNKLFAIFTFLMFFTIIIIAFVFGVNNLYYWLILLSPIARLHIIGNLKKKLKEQRLKE